MSKLVSEKKILGVGPRLLKAADRLAPLAGTANGLLMPFIAKGGGSAAGAVNVIKTGISGFKFRSPIGTTMDAINQPNVYPIASGVGAWVGGLIAEQVGQELGGSVGGFLKTGGGASMKFGVSSAFMGVLSAYFLEQGGGGGILARGVGKVGGLAMGAGQNTRLRQDNPDIVPDTRTSGVISMDIGRTEY